MTPSTIDIDDIGDESISSSRVHTSHAIHTLILGSLLNTLLVFVPIALVARVLTWSDTTTFLLSTLSLIPLAAILGDLTEHMSSYTGETIGGLINATLGNATELIISLFALRAGLLRIVQASLLGSILSNLLLVLGCAFLAGGLRFKIQHFNRTIATTNIGLLLLAVLSILLPAVLNVSGAEAHGIASELALSRFSSVLMLIGYIAYIVFQLRTHRYLLDVNDNCATSVSIYSPISIVSCMIIVGVLISVLSEQIVDAIEGAALSLGVGQVFIGCIILPIVGNAAEHVSAVSVAYRNKMDLSLGIAIGSSTQIALFVIPLCTLVAWAMDQPLSLYFHPYETTCVFIAVLTVAFTVMDGESNWLKGLMLVFTYLIMGAGFYVHLG